MKKVPVLLAFFFVSISYSQITVINTGTSDNLEYISVIKKNILVSGYTSYLAKSYDECNTMIPLSLPSFTDSQFGFSMFRVDTSVLYLNYTGVPYMYSIWRSNNGGYNWSKKFDTTGWLLQPNFTKFFDAQNGISICLNFKTILTTNGLNTWTVGTWGNNYPGRNATIYGDSTIIFGDLQGGGYISKNRGNSWQGTIGIDLPPFDFAFLNKDTVFSIANPTQVSYEACFQKSFNGGLNWDCKIFTGNNPPGWSQPDEFFLKLCVKKASEIYILARNGLTANGYTGYGVILKTTDLGQTWSRFTTPYKQNLNDMKFINDSIALVCGDNGLLFKWNSKTALYSGIRESTLNDFPVNVFPNPAKDKLQINSANTKINKIEISNVLGQRVFELSDPENEIHINVLPSGVYLVRLEGEKGQRVFKILKE